MKPTTLVLLRVLAALLWVSGPTANASELIFSQQSDNQSTYGPSQLWPASGVNSEVADDFNVVANIDRVSVGGFVWGTLDFQGVYIRFYEFGADNKPGALQHQYFLSTGDPNLIFNQYGGIDATLSPAFAATGRHFVSVQPVANYWYWWSSSSGAPRGQAFYFRNNAIAESWHHGDNLNFNPNADVTFDLYGTLTGPGVITGLSATTLPRSGFLEIFGTNLGGNGQVLIDGISAIVATRENARVVAYVPETARLTTVPVQVFNDSGQPSNTVYLTVTARAANGRVKWRLQAASDYILQRPAVGADGTVVAHDSNGFVYALQPDGGLKWIFKTRVFAAGPPAIGPDNTIYVADSGTITAINPDGSLKWTFDEPSGGQGIIAGPGVGPDGNIYAVTDLGGLGALALSPTGQLLWSNHGDPVMAEYGQLGVEMSFGPSHSGGPVDQFYVTFDDFGTSNRDHMYAFRLTTGEQVWTVPIFMSKDTSGMMQQQRPIVGPDGTIFLSAAVQTGANWSLNAFNPANGTLLRSYFPSPGLGMGVPTVGPDNTVYFGQSLSYLQGVSANFAPRWTFFDGSILSNPVASPANGIVFTGGAPNYGMPGFARAFSTSTGQLLWSLNLGIENGGNQVMESIPRFTPDGSTVYFGTAILGGNTTSCFLYAVDTGNAVLQNAVSRKTHGPAGSFDVSLPLSGTPAVECRSGGVTNDYQLIVNFSDPVTVNGNPQAAVTLGTGTIGSGGVGNGGVVTVSGNTVTIPLTNVANAQTINVTLFGVNGAGNVMIPMSVLVGDVNANRAVNASDVAQDKSQIGQTVGSTNFRTDVNANGTISASDVAIIKSNIGSGLP